MTGLSIIVLSYNTKNLTIKCLRSISNQYKKQLEDDDFEIIVVDNASSDNTVATIDKQLSANNKNYLKIIQNRENYGFSKGNNIGTKKAKGEYLLFLNSDTEVQDAGLFGMVEFLEGHRVVGILGGRLRNNDGSLQKSAGAFYTLFNVFLMLFGGERTGMLRRSPFHISQVDWVSGAFMMIRQELFEKLKGFDENFFMYIEDMEICFRAKKLGFSTYFYPDVSVLHKELGSSNRTFAIVNIYKGLLYFYKKHKTRFEYQLLRGLLLMKALLMVFLGSIVRNTYLISTYKKALKVSV